MDRRDILVQAVKLDTTATFWFNALCKMMQYLPGCSTWSLELS
jgi:hypothetical protein